MRSILRHRRIAGVIALGAVLVSVAGCYSTRTRVPEHVKSIAVPMFQNKTYIEDYTRKLDTEVTEAVRKTFLQNGKLEIRGRESADLIVEGQVVRFERRIIRADRFGEPAETQIVIQATISVYDVKAAKYLIQAALVTNEQEKVGSGSYNLRRGEDETLGRKNAIEDLGRAIAHKVVDF